MEENIMKAIGGGIIFFGCMSLFDVAMRLMDSEKVDLDQLLKRILGSGMIIAIGVLLYRT